MAGIEERVWRRKEPVGVVVLAFPIGNAGGSRRLCGTVESRRGEREGSQSQGGGLTEGEEAVTAPGLGRGSRRRWERRLKALAAAAAKKKAWSTRGVGARSTRPRCCISGFASHLKLSEKVGDLRDTKRAALHHLDRRLEPRRVVCGTQGSESLKFR